MTQAIDKVCLSWCEVENGGAEPQPCGHLACGPCWKKPQSAYGDSRRTRAKEKPTQRGVRLWRVLPSFRPTSRGLKGGHITHLLALWQETWPSPLRRGLRLAVAPILGCPAQVGAVVIKTATTASYKNHGSCRRHLRRRNVCPLFPR